MADDTVNAQLAQDIGEKQVISMSGPNVFDFSFKKKDMVITMKTKSVMSIDGESVHVDSTLLFQRLITVYSLEELSIAFEYELSSQPMSLFDKDGLMNDADKRKLKEALEKLVGKPYDKTPDNSKYVLDGDSLLYKVQWSAGQTFNQICDNYKSYIRKRYGQYPTIVFDGGYNVASTKDSTHIRRAKGRVGKKVQLSLGNKLTILLIPLLGIL